jgi:hypothetical protein
MVRAPATKGKGEPTGEKSNRFDQPNQQHKTPNSSASSPSSKKEPRTETLSENRAGQPPKNKDEG